MAFGPDLEILLAIPDVNDDSWNGYRRNRKTEINDQISQGPHERLVSDATHTIRIRTGISYEAVSVASVRVNCRSRRH